MTDLATPGAGTRPAQSVAPTEPVATPADELVAALVTDRYLEDLLAAAERRAADVPADAGLEPALRATARRLGAELVRVHPSFRFEEGLSARLAATADAMAEGLGLDRSAPLRLLPTAPGDRATVPAIVTAASRRRPSRRLVVTGALGSVLLSLLGALFLAWRHRRDELPIPAIPAIPALAESV
jgi:hypothetical protein